MSKQTAAPPSAAKAEEQQRSTGVMDAPPDAVDSNQLKQERDEAKERQKDRLSALSHEELIEIYRQMILIRRFEEKSETIPIIFVTGVHVTEFDRLKGYKAGAIDYVYIPV